MRIICNEKDLNIRFVLPKNDILIGKLKFNIETIDMKKRIANIYMKEIGFKPHMNNREYVYYKAKTNDDCSRITVSKYNERGNCASVSNEQDISNLDSMRADNLLNNFVFINSKLDDLKNELLLNVYKIIKLDEMIFEIIKTDIIKICYEDKNLMIYLDNDKMKIEDIESLLLKIDYYDSSLVIQLMNIVFNGFVNEIGFMDIWKEFEEFLRSYCPNENLYKLISYYYYIGQLKFLNLAEFLIKNNMSDKLIKSNPALYNPIEGYCNKEIPEIKDIKVLSKTGMALKEAYNFREDEIDIILEVEINPKIGVNGLKIIDEYLSQLIKIGGNWDSIFRSYRYDLILKNINIIINKFNITPKKLMNRIVRAMFNENININHYLEVITDTIEMAEMLKVDLGEKLPTDIINIHDNLSTQLIIIQNEFMEKQFKHVSTINDNLINSTPKSNKYTVVNPLTTSDLINEGLNLNHCVGSYVKRYISGYSKIYFIREKECINQSFITVELTRNNELIQAKGRSNRTPEKEVFEFINQWLKNINKE